MGDARGISCLQMNGNVAENGRIWISRFRNFLCTTKLERKPENVRCAQLLHYIGEDGYRIYKTFKFEDEEVDKLEILIKKFENHFLPKENLSYERYTFFNLRQKHGQSIEQFMTTLKKQAIKCKFEKLHDTLVKCMIMTGVSNSKIREKLLQDDEITLDEVIKLCLTVKKAKEQTSIINNGNSNPVATEESNEVDAVQHHKKGQYNNYNKYKNNHSKNYKNSQKSIDKNNKRMIKNCIKCNKTHEINNCPAFGKVCNKCKLKNHFANACRSKKVNVISEECNDILYVSSIDNDNQTSWTADLDINKMNLKFKIDTGASCNILPMHYLKQLNINKNKLKKTNVKLTSYTNNKLKIIGTIEVNCKKGNQMYENVQFHVVGTNTQAILGLTSSVEMNFVRRVDHLTENGNINLEYDKVIENYKEIFNGIGCLKVDPCKIQLKENSKPIVHPTRLVPLALLAQLKQTLNTLIDNNIFERVEGPSEWVNALVLVKKSSGVLRVCLDPKDFNLAIKREYCNIPTFEEITSELKWSTYFSTLDANNGFYQIKLDESSTHLFTFGTPFGRFKFLRLPYGIVNGSEIFHDRFSKIFKKKGTEVYIDDILIHGKDKEEHDRRLRDVLETAKKRGVKFNYSKCQFGKNKLKFMGHIITNKAILPDNNKTEAITNMPSPTNKKELQRVLGVLNYVSKFIPNFSIETTPLRELLKNNVHFESTEDFP